MPSNFHYISTLQSIQRKATMQSFDFPPCSQDLCKYNEYSHLHSVCVQLQCEEPFLSTSFQANALG